MSGKTIADNPIIWQRYKSYWEYA